MPLRPARCSYAELLAEAERAARALLTRFTPGERVAVWAPNSPEWIILEFGAALAGLTLVTVNPAYQGDELVHVLGDSAADGLFHAGGASTTSLPRSAAACPACATSGRSASGTRSPRRVTPAMTASGKVRKDALRDQLGEAAADPSPGS